MGAVSTSPDTSRGRRHASQPFVARVAMLVASLALAPGAALSQPQRSDAALQAFTNAVLIDGTGAAAVEHATVVVRGDRIVSAGPAASVTVPGGARITDLRGKVLMPGLADMHVHLMGGWDGVATDMLGYRRYMNAL